MELANMIRKNDDKIAVDGRELHEFLKVETPYRIWFPRMLEYGFTENVDYVGFEQKSTKPTGGRPQINHAMSLDMAKEISMIQRTDEGKKARQYFIAMESQAKELPMTPAEKIHLLLQNSDRTNQRLDKIQAQVIELRDHQPLNPGEYNRISRSVNYAVRRYVDDHSLKLTRKQRAELYKDINNGVKQVTGVRTRSQLRQQDFDKTEEFIQSWEPSTATKQIIRQLDESAEQMRMEV
ncbi:antA/AntB antirepressor family protein [Lactiplantibacillus daowaiensis]|uniref:AntA/AntB antirepressor family protein n=1 Tax=Lactiplantibacillus daowaiensis TaxID=2559918 RepID=A0ABW1RXS1_9LACO|nr:antA/AntB antirepressor family protein [Lactiplantibacillus daowaiensis]